MQTILKITVLLLAIALSVPSLSAQEEQKKDSVRLRDQIAYTDAVTGTAFPMRIGYFIFGGGSIYRTPELGFSVRYVSQFEKIDVYLYDDGVKGLKTGVIDDKVKEQMKTCNGHIEKAKEFGYYDYVKFIHKSEPVVIDTGTTKFPFLLSELKCKEGERLHREHPEKVSFLYLSAFKDKFLKIRITVDAGKIDEARIKIYTSLKELIAYITKNEPGKAKSETKKTK